MKKQLLILIVAVFAISFSNAYGQIVPRPVTCLTSDALHPVAGNPYNYTIDIPATPTPGSPWGAGTLNYLWFVTQDPDFIVAGVLTGSRETTAGSLLAVTNPLNYNVTTNTANTISLTWKSFTYDPADPIFVVINVVGSNGVCDPMNMRVFKIEPLNAFTLDLDNLTELGASNTPTVFGDNYSQCISPIVSATYDAAAPVPGGVTYDFGQNVLLYEVIAANWSDAWNLSVNLSGIDPLETIKVEWSKTNTFPAASTFAMAGPTNSTGVAQVMNFTNPVGQNVTASAAGGTVGAAGEIIYIRVTLDHSFGALSYQGLADQLVVMAVDGTTVPASGTGLGDIHYQAGAVLPAQDCPWVDLFANDIANQTVKARQTINAPAMPAPGLLPVRP